jgi:hypothetical protein
MNRVPHFTTLSVAAVIALGACAGGASSGDNADLTDNAHSTLSGTYKQVGRDAVSLGYETITFKSGGKFSAKTAGGTVDGTFKISKTGAQYQIALDTAADSHTFYQSWDGFELNLNLDALGNGQTNYYNMGWTKHIPDGDVCEDNTGKSLGECVDSGDFGCGDDGIDGDVGGCYPLD